KMRNAFLARKNGAERVAKSREKQRCNRDVTQGCNGDVTAHIYSYSNNNILPLTPPTQNSGVENSPLKREEAEEDFQGSSRGEEKNNPHVRRLAEIYREAYGHEMPGTWKNAIAGETDAGLLEKITAKDFRTAMEKFPQSGMKIWAWGCVRYYAQQRLARAASAAKPAEVGVYPTKPPEAKSDDSRELLERFRREVPESERRRLIAEQHAKFKFMPKAALERTTAYEWAQPAMKESQKQGIKSCQNTK
ncbi:MAG TPA: hypothetical protein PLK08_05545, partial [Phycisphaerae bacterium]|nr:hypothetical protein [Phycisphaerae bacterium]